MEFERIILMLYLMVQHAYWLYSYQGLVRTMGSGIVICPQLSHHELFKRKRQWEHFKIPHTLLDLPNCWHIQHHLCAGCWAKRFGCNIQNWDDRSLVGKDIQEKTMYEYEQLYTHIIYIYIYIYMYTSINYTVGKL